MRTEPILRKRLRPDDDALFVRHPEDFYTEPYWVSRRLFDLEGFDEPIYDPACGFGRILQSASDAMSWRGGEPYRAFGTDLVARSSWVSEPLDFFSWTKQVPSIVCNPPYSIAEKFLAHALKVATKVAFFLPLKFLFGDERSRTIEATPLKTIWLLTPRPSCIPGPALEAGVSAGSGTEDYCWAVFYRGWMSRPEVRWMRRDG